MTAYNGNNTRSDRSTSEEIKRNYFSANTFISEDLTVEFPEDIPTPFTKNNYATASINSTTLKISCCLLKLAIAISEKTVCGGYDRD